MEFDLLVIGSGPGGQRAAIQASKLGKRVAVVERRHRVGGNSIHFGTIPSKTLRQAVLEGLARRGQDVEGGNRESRERAAVEFLMDRTQGVISAETAVVREQFRRNDVTLAFGEASFIDEHTVNVEDDDDETDVHIRADKIVIAVGTNPSRPPDVEFDDATVIDSDGVLRLDRRVPRTMTVVGAGVIGVEYASMFGQLGTKVTVVDARGQLLPFLDGEIGEALQYLLRRHNVTFRFREEVTAVERRDGVAIAHLASGKQIPSETVLYATGRQGAVDGLELERIGLEADRRGRIPVGADHRTKISHIFVVGDVAGPPGLAATAMEQGRIAALHAFGQPVTQLPELVPTGIYAIPEVSMVGRTEEELTEAAVPYVTGIARWSELARGLMTGDEDGMLKLIVSPSDGSLLGVHVLGTGATDLVHIGQAVMGGSCGIDFLVSAVFNYPTFAESYKVAALDALNRIKLLPDAGHASAPEAGDADGVGGGNGYGGAKDSDVAAGHSVAPG